MTSLKLSAGERDELRDLQIRVTDAEVYRNVTMLLMLDKGRSKTSIARDFGCSPAKVDEVLEWYRRLGQGKLPTHLPKRTGGNGVILNITNRCNFKCGTCLRGAQTAEDMPFDYLTSFLEQGKAYGIQKCPHFGLNFEH